LDSGGRSGSDLGWKYKCRGGSGGGGFNTLTLRGRFFLLGLFKCSDVGEDGRERIIDFRQLGQTRESRCLEVLQGGRACDKCIHRSACLVDDRGEAVVENIHHELVFGLEGVETVDAVLHITELDRGVMHAGFKPVLDVPHPSSKSLKTITNVVNLLQGCRRELSFSQSRSRSRSSRAFRLRR
jgi:hypothetical protein